MIRGVRRGGGLVRVAGSEQRDVRQQRIQLVQRNAFRPVAPQWMHAVITVDDRAKVRTSEQREHRQIGLAMPAVRSGVDEYRSGLGPHHVAAPQITVQPGRTVVVVEVACSAA